MVAYVVAEVLRWVSVAFLTVIGGLAALATVKTFIYIVGEWIWRIPKGLIELDFEILKLVSFLSEVLLVLFCYLAVSSLIRLRWSRRTRWMLAITGMGSAVSFIVAVTMIGYGLSQMS